MTYNEYVDAVKKKIEGGWCQREFCKTGENGKPEYCLMGAIPAINSSDYIEDLSYKLYKKIYDIIKQEILVWNDERGRTKQEVLDLLESCKE